MEGTVEEKVEMTEKREGSLWQLKSNKVFHPIVLKVTLHVIFSLLKFLSSSSICIANSIFFRILSREKVKSYESILKSKELF